MYKAVLFGICGALIFSRFAFAGTITLLPEKSKIAFHAVGHPSFLHVNGAASQIVGSFISKDKKVQGSVTLKLENLDTGIDLRNTHMKTKYLEIEKYPEAIFMLKTCVLPEDLDHDLSLADLPFQGTLQIHGVEKMVEGKVGVKKVGVEVNLSAEFKVRISDFKIPEPGYKGITLADEVTVDVEAVAKYATGVQ